MATNDGASQEPASDLPIEHWRLARYGMSLLINNRADEAQNIFSSHDDSIQMAAGLSFATFLDALMSFEEEKLQRALATLRDTEKKCAAEIGWMKCMKKAFGGKTNSLAHTLESQVILADTQVCVAILTFLQQEISGYVKGVWVLRKAWKVYQHAYKQISDLYKEHIGEFNLPEPTDFTWEHDEPSSSSVTPTKELGCEWAVPSSETQISDTELPGLQNGYIPSPPHSKPKLPHSQSAYAVGKSKGKSLIPRSTSSFSSANPTIYNSQSVFSFLSLTSRFQYFTSSLSLFSKNENNSEVDVETETISRLMAAVCFGYGVLQLGISLLPPSLLRVTSFLGFGGNRTAGISNLMYARKGTDMRSPLATLSLLWFHTIVRPFFALDGNNVMAGVKAANLLIAESRSEYSESALFLFFQGRTYRLESNISKALEAFEHAVENSRQREIKQLCLHEVGWCHLIQLDYEKSQKTFAALKSSSRWSRAFYSYLLILCTGATGGLRDLALLVQLKEMLQVATQKDAQLDVFMQRRAKVFPRDLQELKRVGGVFWRLLVYEMLFLWNAMPSCDAKLRDVIIKDCESASSEPMPGLAMLIQGDCYNINGCPEEAVRSYRACLKIRAESTLTPQDDTHISAFAEFELASLLVKNHETQNEGMLMFHHANTYKDYDFDNKLQVRLDMALKH